MLSSESNVQKAKDAVDIEGVMLADTIDEIEPIIYLLLPLYITMISKPTVIRYARMRNPL